MPENLDPLLSVSAAAREIGVHQSTLSKQVREGAVRSHDGKVRLSEVLADRAANIDLGRSNRRRGAIDDPGATTAPVPAEPDVEDVGADDAVPESGVMVDGVAVSYAAARAMKEGYLAKLKQLEFETKRGALVSVDDAVAEFTRVLGVIRERLLAMPGKLAAPSPASRSSSCAPRSTTLWRSSVSLRLASTAPKPLRTKILMAMMMLAPPPQLNLVQWADRFRRVAQKTSAAPGKWRTSAQPVAFGPMMAVSEPDTHTVTVMAATQVLKTELLLNVVFYFIHQDPMPILFIQPTQDAAAAFAKERFNPTVEVMPKLKALIQAPRAGTNENTLTHRDFPAGNIDFVGAHSPLDLASRPRPVIVSDEINKFPVSAGDEGDPAGARRGARLDLRRCRPGQVRPHLLPDCEGRVPHRAGVRRQRPAQVLRALSALRP